jgi:hypothetical protein
MPLPKERTSSELLGLRRRIFGNFHHRVADTPNFG